MDLAKIRELIKLVEASDINGILIEEGDNKIEVKKYPDAVNTAIAAPQSFAVAPAAAPKAEVVNVEAKDPTAGLAPMKSPMTGTFYSASSPDVPPFIKVGDTVTKGQIVCIVEAMKTFNQIESEVSGRVEKILVNNATPVELGQPLFLVKE